MTTTAMPAIPGPSYPGICPSHLATALCASRSQPVAEACTGIAAEQRVPGVESLDGEQVPGPAQAFDVAVVHGPVPLSSYLAPAGLAQAVDTEDRQAQRGQQHQE